MIKGTLPGVIMLQYQATFFGQTAAVFVQHGLQFPKSCNVFSGECMYLFLMNNVLVKHRGLLHRTEPQV